MSRFSKALKAFRLILKNPSLLNNVIDDEGEWMKYVEKKYGLLEGLPVVDAVELFGGFDETVEPFAFLDGGSLPTDIALLKKLAGKFQDCSYFEIGTWRGESVANVAAVAKTCFTLNLPDEEMRNLGLSEEYIGMHGYFSKDLENVTHLKGNSLTYDFESQGRKFDLIFIDGDHHYEMVKNDTEKVFQHLTHDNSVVVWHDYAYNPEKPRFSVLAGILDGTPQKYHDRIYHFANSLCAIYINSAYDTARLDPPVRPEKHFRVQLNLKSKD